MADFDILGMHMPNSKNKRKVKGGELCDSLLSRWIRKNSCKLTSMTILMFIMWTPYNVGYVTPHLTQPPGTFLTHLSHTSQENHLASTRVNRIIYNELPRVKGCELGERDRDSLRLISSPFQNLSKKLSLQVWISPVKGKANTNHWDLKGGFPFYCKHGIN